MNKILYLIRGVSGAGKSTFANTLGCPVLAADDYFSQGGEYKFDASRLKEAHSECARLAKLVMEHGTTFAVANTFTQEWEMKPYLDLAEKFGYVVFSVIVENRHGGANIHGVPPETVLKQAERFEVRL